jgi:hypothetical protein
VKEIGTTKIGKQMPKPSITYPTIRLPQDRANIIGETVTLYETKHEGRQAFLIVVGNKVAQPVAQLCEKNVQNTYNERLIELENQIEEIVGRNSQNETPLSSERGFPDGPAEIRTQDLRHVKATS